jgi:hypothetical protein
LDTRGLVGRPGDYKTHKQINGWRKGVNAEGAAGGHGRRDEGLDGLQESTDFVQLFVFHFLEAFDPFCRVDEYAQVN